LQFVIPESLIVPNRKIDQNIRASAIFNQVLLRNFVLHRRGKAAKPNGFLGV